jgi:hypothetical protein
MTKSVKKSGVAREANVATMTYGRGLISLKERRSGVPSLSQHAENTVVPTLSLRKFEFARPGAPGGSPLLRGLGSPAADPRLFVALRDGQKENLRGQRNPPDDAALGPGPARI